MHMRMHACAHALCVCTRPHTHTHTRTHIHTHQPDASKEEQAGSLLRTRTLLQRLLNVLFIQYGWPAGSILLLGYSQGGAVVLDLVGTVFSLYTMCRLLFI